jgi:hypothetical protein
MRSDCQHPDCLKQDLKDGFRYCDGEHRMWAEKRTLDGLAQSKTQQEAVAVLTKFALKWQRI